MACSLTEARYGEVTLDGLNAVVVARSPEGPMGEGNWTVAAYLDERADEWQRRALQTIFTGAAGGQPAIPGCAQNTENWRQRRRSFCASVDWGDASSQESDVS